LSDDEVLAGLGAFLGADGPPDPAKVRAKVQNPTPVAARLTNPSQAEEALAALSSVDLGHIPSFEPDRGPGLRFFRVGHSAPLIYMPIRGAWEDPVPDWLKTVDPEGKIDGGMTQKDMRRWKRQHPGHRSFTVLRHPLLRVHDAFCRHILPSSVDNFACIRAALSTQYDVPLPINGPDENGYDLNAHRAAFLAFLKFLSGNLGGQTSVRVDNSWASQAALLHAIGDFVVPDRVIRSETMDIDLPALAQDVGLDPSNVAKDHGVTSPFALEDVYDSAIERACEAAYHRDYVMFGFAPWQPA
ncbi:MAG: nodulation protein NodH, partial [Pseudomonadota bacterium]